MALAEKLQRAGGVGVGLGGGVRAGIGVSEVWNCGGEDSSTDNEDVGMNPNTGHDPRRTNPLSV